MLGSLANSIPLCLQNSKLDDERLLDAGALAVVWPCTCLGVRIAATSLSLFMTESIFLSDFRSALGKGVEWGRGGSEASRTISSTATSKKIVRGWVV